MATAFAANGPVETATIRRASDVSAHHLTISTPLDTASTVQPNSSSPLPSPRINLPPPNPPFTFPPRPSSSSAPSTFSRAAGRRPRSAIEFQGRHLDFTNEVEDRPTQSPALPDFSFNPGATHGPKSTTPTLPDFSFNPGPTHETDETLLSPPLTPQSPRGSQLRNGHRRGGSEFVGGKLKVGQSITVMSTSPTKSESGFASPKLSPTDMPPRRGHAHRRSAAISSHDLSMILKPNNSPTAPNGTSVPASPADFGEELRISRDQPNREPPKIQSNPGEPVERKIEETIQPSLESSPIIKPAGRARVGFSDTLEYIPRPVSVISSDASSTATARPGHKVSGSISSIISTTNSATTDRDQHGLLGSPVPSTRTSSRPSTAGAILERTPSLHVPDENSQSPRRRNSIPLLTGLSREDAKPSRSPSPTKAPRRWSFFGLESLASGGSPIKPRPSGSSSLDSISNTQGSADSLSGQSHDMNVGDAVSQANGRKVAGKFKKQKKVRSWAGSILTRKSKSRAHKSKSARRRSQTPPLRRMHRDEDFHDDHVEVPKPSPTPIVLVTEPTHTETDMEAAKPIQTPDDDATYPVIDLDAALGPFNTPSARDPQWEEAQRAGAPPKRQLHSAAGMRGFSGPGMHYHRRAESAPEMPPFEAARFGIQRFGSSSTMADVFEEDEEEEHHSGNSLSEGSTPEAQEGSGDEVDDGSDTDDAASTPTQERDLGITSSQENSHSASTKRKGSGSSSEMQPIGSRMRSETSANSLHEEIIMEEPNYNAPERKSSIPGPQETSDSAAPSPRTILNNEDSGSVEMSPTTVPSSSMLPVSPYSTSHSSFPSPRSPMSYDAHRISTAPSSVADENNYHSLLMGEPGPELVRISVEVPSLTSSNSTMTRESMFTPGVRPRNMPFHEQRPASFTSTSFGRRRSSLASLSRLISSAHGERSKLSMEVPCESESDKKSKPSKSKRLGRMMQFWKPKGSTES